MIDFIRKISTLFLLILTFQCFAQKKSDRGIIDETVEVISHGVPYKLNRENVFLKLPYGFFEEDINGFIILSVCLSSAGVLESSKIMKLQVNTVNKVKINYINESNLNLQCQKSEYPEEIQKYLPVIEEYLSGLKFERDERIALKIINEITFIVRLK